MIKVCQQIAALPYILVNDRPKILLITSRRSECWIIPKGWPKDGMDDHQLAALEAFEEAGLGGQPGKEPIGYFDEIKQHPTQNEIEHRRIRVFPFLVQYHHIEWPEKGQRKHTWLEQDAAANLVENENLAAILSAFDPSY
jgi:8-oxo-dGTP pyrophosphatase MutT (NUDIX family)